MTENYGPGGGPDPLSPGDEELSDLLAGQRFGALATIQADGRPQLSTVAYTWDPRRRVVRISTIADRLKVRQLQKDPRCSLYVASDDFRVFAVAEGEAELSPVSLEAGDEVGLELLAMRGAALSEPEAQLAFLRQMVADRRLVIRLRVSRLYGTALPVG
ncbi:PPOX class F420-dependent oxidoreductase [Nonomuraea gerenzanensis]|uniref:Pyridoxine 5'-phosphate oxidase, Rv1155 n=1 Tax=Nonomuraea gerenzanensis TaxID=93944 RepID=A0A1M4ELL0_9ACTN|nr:PPOX class F420-dependent oxidoreductase [Nonomuraea gerenzanensis]UBU10999.1 PPOX class F420-dependent oxidoreductase [Nonomuraea gerenzanensis]SBO99453.1 Pyridoxine 5'-phosphate oxidase, Rv1155 [Nonomuraea gerenzanensis]